MSRYGTAHFYAQGAWHDPVHLMADRRGLIQIKEAVEAALEAGQAMTELFANDGEGYPLFVVRSGEDGPFGTEWDSIAKPYTEPYAAEQDEQAMGPWDLLDLEKMVPVGPEQTQKAFERMRDSQRARLAEENQA